MPKTTGIHHITAISGPAQETLDFYTQGLGLRLVKTTVNFDDPGTYHLYVGDATGRPGSILTFFPWAHAVAGQTGAGMVQATAFAIPEASLDYWTNRLPSTGARHVAEPIDRVGTPVIRFRDPHGLPLELVATPGGGSVRWVGRWPGFSRARHPGIRQCHACCGCDRSNGGRAHHPTGL